MNNKLTESEFEDLSAWLDGELDSVRAAEVAQLVENDPAWTKACHELRNLDNSLDAWPVPAVPEKLARYIITDAKIPPRSTLNRILHWATPAAAAAALIMGILLHFSSMPQNTGFGDFNNAGGGFNRTKTTKVRQAQGPVQKNLKIIIRLTPQQQKVIFDSFTPLQQQQLRQMTPAQRGKAFLARREILIRSGLLSKQ